MTAEDTTPSEREAPQRFAWWHPQSADLGRRAEYCFMVNGLHRPLKIVCLVTGVRGKRTQDRDWTVAPAYSMARYGQTFDKAVRLAGIS